MDGWWLIDWRSRGLYKGQGGGSLTFDSLQKQQDIHSLQATAPTPHPNMKLAHSLAILSSLTYTAMAAYFGNATVASIQSNGQAALDPAYTVAPVTTVVTYQDPTTTFFVTQTKFTTIYYDTPAAAATPAATPATTPAPASTATSEFVSTYTDESTTYTSTITSTYIVYATLPRKDVTTLAPAPSPSPSASPSTVTTEIVSTYADEHTTYTSTITSTLIIHLTQNLENKQLDKSMMANDEITTTYTTTVGVTATKPQQQQQQSQQSQQQLCQDATQFVTVTQSPQIVTVTETPQLKYITVTVGQQSTNGTSLN